MSGHGTIDLSAVGSIVESGVRFRDRNVESDAALERECSEPIDGWTSASR